MVDFDFKHTGTSGQQTLLSLGDSSISVSPQWFVLFASDTGSTLYGTGEANKIVITNNSLTSHNIGDASTHLGDNAGIAQGISQGNKPGVGIRSNINFAINTTYKIKIIWEAYLPAPYTESNVVQHP